MVRNRRRLKLSFNFFCHKHILLQRYIKYLLVFVVLLAGVLICRGEGSGGVLIRGIVRDSLTTEGLPYSSVVVDGSCVTSLTDSRGLFELTLPYGSGQITASCRGYAPKTIPVKRQGLQIYDIYLVPQATELAEVVVKKKKYSKRNNPAVDFCDTPAPPWARIRSAAQGLVQLP